ncbi:tetratricopeptide repeat protein [Pontimicrobium sp. MEBiC01747]
MKLKHLLIFFNLWLVVSINTITAQSNAQEVAAIIDTIKSLENEPLKRAEYVSKIDHLYIEIYSPQFYTYVKREFDAASTIEDLDVKFDIYHLMEAIYYAFSDYDSAATIAYDLLKIAQQTKKPEHLYFAYSSIAADEEQLGSTYKALEFLLQANEYTAHDESLRAKSNIELSYIFMDLDNYKEAYKYILKGIDIATKENNTLQLMYAYSTMGEYYYQTENYNQALLFIAKADSIAEIDKELATSRDIMENSMTAGAIYIEKNEPIKAKHYLNKAMALANQANDLETTSLIYSFLSKLEEHKKNYIQSLEYYKQYTELNDSIFNETSSKQLNALKITYELEKKNLEIVTAKKNEEYSKKQSWLVISIGIVFIGALILLLLYSKSKLKASKIATELNDKKNKINKIEIKNLEFEVQLKNKELADLFLHQYEKAQLLTNVIDNIDRSNDELKTNLQEQLNKNEDWTNFKLHFDKVHEGFFKKLNEVAPNLTSKDIRYCAYIRMNLTSKEIAIMLGISHRTVQGIRGRVRKKLNLDSKDDLVLYLMNL